MRSRGAVADDPASLTRTSPAPLLETLPRGALAQGFNASTRHTLCMHARGTSQAKGVALYLSICIQTSDTQSIKRHLLRGLKMSRAPGRRRAAAHRMGTRGFQLTLARGLIQQVHVLIRSAACSGAVNDTVKRHRQVKLWKTAPACVDRIYPATELTEMAPQNSRPAMACLWEVCGAGKGNTRCWFVFVVLHHLVMTASQQLDASVCGGDQTNRIHWQFSCRGAQSTDLHLVRSLIFILAHPIRDCRV